MVIWQQYLRPFDASAIIGNMSSTLTIIYERGDDGGWIASVAEVPGAFSQGKSQAEARENAIDALQELMAASRDLALKQRAKGSVVESVQVAV